MDETESWGFLRNGFSSISGVSNRIRRHMRPARDFAGMWNLVRWHPGMRRPVGLGHRCKSNGYCSWASLAVLRHRCNSKLILFVSALIPL